MSLPAKKSLGQNFLADRSYLAPILAAAALAPTDRVLEIGAGTGVLTEALAERAGCVVAVELDHRLVEPLRQRFTPQPHIHIIHGDILEHAPAQLITAACPQAGESRNVQDQEMARLGEDETTSQSLNPPIFSLQSPIPYKVVANLPYYITSAALRHLLEAEQPPSLAVLMVQWEVAQRICAEPGDLSILAVSVQFYAEPRIVQRVPARAFFPRPKVDSAILQLTVRPRPAVDVDPATFFRIVRAGFGQKRKQLHNSLAAGMHLDKATVQMWMEQANLDPARRAETLQLAEWGELCRSAPAE